MFALDSIPRISRFLDDCEKDQGKELDQMMNVLTQSGNLKKKLRQGKKLRTAWAIYVATSGVYGFLASGREAELQNRLEECMGAVYNRTEELRQEELLVPLAGNLDADLMLNFVARNCAMENDPMQLIETMKRLYRFTFFAQNCAIRSWNLSFFSPQCPQTEEDLKGFFRKLLRKSSVAASYSQTDGGIHLILPNSPLTQSVVDALSWGQPIPHLLPFTKFLFGLPGADQMPLPEPDSDTLAQVENLNTGLSAVVWVRTLLRAEQLHLEQERIAILGPETAKNVHTMQAKLEQEQTEMEMDQMRRDLSTANARFDAQQRQMSDLRDRCLKAEAIAARLEKENRSMVEALLHLPSGEADDEEADEEQVRNLDTSIFDDLNVLVIGGHPGFVTGMQKMDANIRYFGNTKPSDTAVQNADAIWFQTNCLGHKIYEGVMNQARTWGIPVRYFERSGHVKGRLQIVAETEAMMETGELPRYR